MSLGKTIFVTLSLFLLEIANAGSSTTIMCLDKASHLTANYVEMTKRMETRNTRFDHLRAGRDVIFYVDHEIKPKTDTTKVAALGNIEMALPVSGGLKKFGVFVVETVKGKALLVLHHRPFEEFNEAYTIQEYFSEMGHGTHITNIIFPDQLSALMKLHPELNSESKASLPDMKPKFATLIEFKEDVQPLDPAALPIKFDLSKVIHQLELYRDLFLKLKIMALDVQFLVDSASNLYLSDFDDFLWQMPNGNFLERNKEIPESEAIPLDQTTDDINNLIKNLTKKKAPKAR